MNEVRHYEKTQQYPCTVMDFGAEEIEFYTLNYPKSLGMDRECEKKLTPVEVEQKVKEWVDLNMLPQN